MVSILENIFQISGVILLLCGIYFYWHFRKMKKEKKLTSTERVIYMITQITLYICAGSYLLLFLDK